MIPYVIQYLETLRRPDDGGQLCMPGGFQILMPVVPPGQVNYDIIPAQGYYAYIGYRLSFDPAMVPLAWMMTIIQWGAQPYTGALSGDILRDGLDTIMVVTAAQPCHTYAINVTVLNQFACVNGFLVTITSEEDYNASMEALKHLGTAEAVALLQQMADAQCPRPPAEGRS
jgi:hypothetical protein